MNLLIDNSNGMGQQDYTPWLDADAPTKIVRRLNRPTVMTAELTAGDASFRVPTAGARVILQKADGTRVFTGYLAEAPAWSYRGMGSSGGAWSYTLHAVDDSIAADKNVLPTRTPFTDCSAGDVVKGLTSDALGGALDVSNVQPVSPVNQFQPASQAPWSEQMLTLATASRGCWRANDGKLYFEPVAQRTLTISDQDASFDATALALAQPDELHNDVTLEGELEPQVYVRDYFVGDGMTLAFYLSEWPFGLAGTVFAENYQASLLTPTLWEINDSTGAVTSGNGQLQVNGGPATVSYVEPLELAGGVTMRHGQVSFGAPSSGMICGLYNGSIVNANCIAGFLIAASGAGSSIQAVINGAPTGPVVSTVAGHVYSFATRILCSEGARLRQSYLSSQHPAGSGRGGDTVATTARLVLAVHDVDPNNPATLGAVATVLFDGVLAAPPAFATYALINSSNLHLALSFTQLQRVPDAEVRSQIPGGSFRTRLAGALADGGECSVSGAGEVRFFPQYPPQPNEQIVVSYRTSGRAMARVQDQNSIAAQQKGSDRGQRMVLRRVQQPAARTSRDCENAALATLDDAVLPAWRGTYATISDFLTSDPQPGDAVAVNAASRNAQFSATVREVEMEMLSLADERWRYSIGFANDAAATLAFESEALTLATPLAQIWTTTNPSSSQVLDALAAAQITAVTPSTVTMDAGTAPPAGGGIEVRRSDAGWGAGSAGNLAGRFTTTTFTLPRLSRAQAYYLRQYDASAPVKYSRHSALLYVDYPL
jgi:hypothetical protein